MYISEPAHGFVQKKKNTDGILIEITLNPYGRYETVPYRPSATGRLIDPGPQMLPFEIHCFLWGNITPATGCSPVKD